ncbi:MAG TPA: peptide deformylase [Methylomirabilota bacterium]|jgi:peptide deformylase|nr:peptide deformylase [Methylomirabilota bacterium]
MAVLSVRLYGDPVLRTVAEPVNAVTPEIKKIIGDLVDTMWHQVGIGLAAPQIGISLRLLVMDDGKGGARTLINPVITERGGSVREEEGCLSLPGIFADVERSKWVRVSAEDDEGRPVAFEAQGLQAKVIQHEIDHLDGVLFIDRLPPVTRDRIKKRIQKEGLGKPTRHQAFAL